MAPDASRRTATPSPSRSRVPSPVPNRIGSRRQAVVTVRQGIRHPRQGRVPRPVGAVPRPVGDGRTTGRLPTPPGRRPSYDREPPVPSGRRSSYEGQGRFGPVRGRRGGEGPPSALGRGTSVTGGMPSPLGRTSPHRLPAGRAPMPSPHPLRRRRRPDGSPHHANRLHTGPVTPGPDRAASAAWRPGGLAASAEACGIGEGAPRRPPVRPRSRFKDG